MAAARSQLYGVLSDLFLGEAADGVVKQLLSHAFLDDMAELFGPGAVAYLRQSANELGDGLEAVRQQYNELFVVPLNQYVTPYEAVYRDVREVEGVRTHFAGGLGPSDTGQAVVDPHDCSVLVKRVMPPCGPFQFGLYCRESSVC